MYYPNKYEGKGDRYVLYREERSKLESTLTEAMEYPNFKNLPNLTKLQIILNVEAKDARSRDTILSYVRQIYRKKCDIAS